MFSILDVTQSQIEIFLLSLFRTAGIMAIAPIFSHKTFPIQLRFAFSMLLAILIFPFVSSGDFVSPSNLWELLGVGLTEFLLGALIGFMFYMLMVAVQFAGGIVGFQVGFAIVNVIDPSTSQNVSIIGQFQYLLATLLFLMMNGHHMILSGMLDSFTLVPLGMVKFQFAGATEIIRLSAGVFILAVKIASPVMLALFLTDTALGVIARTVPQMNIFIVGFPLKIGIGLFVVGLTVPIFAYVFQGSLVRLQENLSSLIVSIAR